MKKKQTEPCGLFFKTKKDALSPSIAAQVTFVFERILGLGEAATIRLNGSWVAKRQQKLNENIEATHKEEKPLQYKFRP